MCLFGLLTVEYCFVGMKRNSLVHHVPNVTEDEEWHKEGEKAKAAEMLETR